MQKIMEKPGTSTRLTMDRLQKLKSLGFLYMLVRGYSPSRKSDFIELDHFNLVPVKELPKAQGEKGIYAPIDSEIIEDWAQRPEGGISAYIEGYSLCIKGSGNNQENAAAHQE
jgi:hypothetical protein